MYVCMYIQGECEEMHRGSISIARYALNHHEFAFEGQNMK